MCLEQSGSIKDVRSSVLRLHCPVLQPLATFGCLNLNYRDLNEVKNLVPQTVQHKEDLLSIPGSRSYAFQAVESLAFIPSSWPRLFFIMLKYSVCANKQFKSFQNKLHIFYLLCDFLGKQGFLLRGKSRFFKKKIIFFNTFHQNLDYSLINHVVHGGYIDKPVFINLCNP